MFLEFVWVVYIYIYIYIYSIVNQSKLMHVMLQNTNVAREYSRMMQSFKCTWHTLTFIMYVVLEGFCIVMSHDTSLLVILKSLNYHSFRSWWRDHISLNISLLGFYRFSKISEIYFFKTDVCLNEFSMNEYLNWYMDAFTDILSTVFTGFWRCFTRVFGYFNENCHFHPNFAILFVEHILF